MRCIQVTSILVFTSFTNSHAFLVALRYFLIELWTPKSNSEISFMVVVGQLLQYLWRFGVIKSERCGLINAPSMLCCHNWVAYKNNLMTTKIQYFCPLFSWRVLRLIGIFRRSFRGRTETKKLDRSIEPQWISQRSSSDSPQLFYCCMETFSENQK